MGASGALPERAPDRPLGPDELVQVLPLSQDSRSAQAVPAFAVRVSRLSVTEVASVGRSLSFDFQLTSVD
jgi:hypothetical protein